MIVDLVIIFLNCFHESPKKDLSLLNGGKFQTGFFLRNQIIIIIILSIVIVTNYRLGLSVRSHLVFGPPCTPAIPSLSVVYMQSNEIFIKIAVRNAEFQHLILLPKFKRNKSKAP
jgi:hypothetical protein